jgi:hypothetical protein
MCYTGAELDCVGCPGLAKQFQFVCVLVSR